MDSPGIPCCPLKAWFKGTPKTVAPPQRHNAAQLHPTSNGWTRLAGPGSCIIVSMPVSSSFHLPRRGNYNSAPHSFLRAKADLGPHLWWLLIVTSTERGTALLRTTAGRTEPGLISFSQTSTIPLPTSPRPFPLPKLPISYTTHPSLPRLLIPSITAHTSCVLPVISACKREVKLQVGTGSVSITREESSEIRPMIKGRVCPGMRFWNKVTGKCCCLRCPLKFSRVLSLPHHSPPPPCARSEVKVYFWLPSKGRGWGETRFLSG